MTLSGFPDQIRVVLGPVWAGLHGLDASTVLVLTRIGVTGYWSEDGTNDFSVATNRLRVYFVQSGASGHVRVTAAFNTWTSSMYVTWWMLLGGAGDTTPVGTSYTFKEVFDADPGVVPNWTAGVMASFMNSSTMGPDYIAAYNGQIFASLEEYVPGGGTPNKNDRMLLGLG